MSYAYYITNCVLTNDSDQLRTLIEKATPITRKVLATHVCNPELKTLEEALGYELRSTSGLTMANDPHVTYYRSIWRGLPAYFIRWSGIEFIFARISRSEPNIELVLEDVLKVRRRQPLLRN